MISAAELSAMRSTVQSSLPGTVVVVRSTATSDGMGGQDEVWAAAGTVAARISPAGAGADNIMGGEFQNVAPWVVTLPAGTDVTDRDRLTYAGQTFEITGSSDPRSWATSIRLECKEVT